MTSILVVVSLFGTLVAAAPHKCIHNFESKGATFDLRSLILKDNFNYHVKDIIDTMERNYTYVFNVCNDVGHLPADYCENDGSLAPAYQVNDVQKTCQVIGRDAAMSTWALLDDHDPTYGVMMTYVGGKHCNDEDETERRFSIGFQCSDNVGLSEFEHQRVVEDACHYKLQVKSLFGCPVQCSVGHNRQLCSGNGFCAQDTDANKPHCFCEDGWSGDDCGTAGPPASKPSSVSSTGVFLVILVIVLASLLTAAVWVFIKVKKLRRMKLYQMDDLDDDDSQTVFSIGDDGTEL